MEVLELIHERLNRIEVKVDKLNDIQNKNRSEISGLKVKVSVWGAIAALLVVVLKDAGTALITMFKS